MQRFSNSNAIAKGCALVFSTSSRVSAADFVACSWRVAPKLLPELINPAQLLWKRAHNSAASSTNASNLQQQRSATTPEDEACIALYFAGTPPSADVFGPVVAADIPGRGRGLVASRPLSVGDLVMAVKPLAVLHGPQDSMPSPDSLVDHLLASWTGLSPRNRTAIMELYGGPGAKPGPDPGAEGQPQPAAPEPSAQAAAAGAAAATADGVDVRAVVSYNAYGDEYEDLPAVDLRGGAAARSHVGLWPHFSTLNHSCAPNCVHYVVDSTMVVRAVQPVPAGSELRISYLGRDDLAPRQVRQAVLQSRYGFRCDCPRCRTEAELPEELQKLLQQLYDRARHELAPRFERLAAAAATATAAEAGLDPAGMTTGLTSSYEYDNDGGDGDGDDEDADSEGAGAGLQDAPTTTVTPSTMTAAEAAKRALRKAGGSVPQWPSQQLAALEPRLEDCARQLHLAIRELQEDDEAAEAETEAEEVRSGAGPAAAPAPAATPAADGSRTPDGAGSAADGRSGSRLTRVQAAQAAAYQLLELLHLHAELTSAAAGGIGGGGRATAALQACWHVLDAISRGSEVQVFQACKLLNDALRESKYGNRGGAGGARPSSSPATAAAAPPPPEAVREAAAMLGQSLLARYGRLRGRQLTQMTQAAMRSSRTFF